MVCEAQATVSGSCAHELIIVVVQTQSTAQYRGAGSGCGS